MSWHTLGHAWAINLLQRAVTHPSHAYLFVGPAHIGKLTLAQDFARALNCTGDAAPCNVCRACQKIANGQHPDVRLVRRLPDKTEIVVDQLRELQNELSLRPYEAQWRIAIIENMHEANASAANAFLKTLEEPNPQVIILLTAHHPEALLPTIRSRCQIIPLRPLPINQVEQALLERQHIEPERARLLARLSGGRIGWALDVSSDEELLAQRNAQLQELLETLSRGRSARIELAGRLSRNDETTIEALDLWLSWWRDLLLVKGQCADAIVNADYHERLARDATHLDLAAIQKYIGAIQRARQHVEQNVNARLALEVMLLTAPTIR
jgi:DNA polymerase-3 subunit delta'